MLQPTEGRFRVGAPAVYSLLELGTGFHPDLTGRENVHHSARLLGLPARLLSPDVVEQIRDFADIGDFFDRPLRFYSSGMQMRLGFSLFAFLEPDLLVVDEALSVGDIFFQQKCAARIDALREAGTSFLFVSHDMEAVRKLCREVLVLDAGRAAFLGPSERGRQPLSQHRLPRPARRRARCCTTASPIPSEGMTADEVLRGNILTPDGRRHGDRGLEIVAARLTDAAGQDTLTVGLKEHLHIDLLIHAHERVDSPSAGFVAVRPSREPGVLRGHGQPRSSAARPAPRREPGRAADRHLQRPAPACTRSTWARRSRDGCTTGTRCWVPSRCSTPVTARRPSMGWPSCPWSAATRRS